MLIDLLSPFSVKAKILNAAAITRRTIEVTAIMRHLRASRRLAGKTWQ